MNMRSAGAQAMYDGGKNEQGCPLYDQTGEVAVRNFRAVVERLPPPLRAAFEAEREQQRAMLASDARSKPR